MKVKKKMTVKKKDDRLTKKQLFGYGLAGIGDNACYSFIGAFLHFFLTTVAKVPTVHVGFITSIGGVFDAIWSPIIGFISDKTVSRYGRRRPYMIGGVLMLAVVVSLLFYTLPVSNVWVKTIYYAVLTLLFWFSYSTFFIPYLALGAELTSDYHERTLLRSYTSTFNIVGGFFGQLLPTSVVAFFVAWGFSMQGAWHLAAVVVAGATLFSILYTWNSTRGREATMEPRKKSAQSESNNANGDMSGHTSDNIGGGAGGKLRSILREYGQIIRLKPLKYLAAGSIIFLVANTFLMTGKMYYFTYFMEFSKFEITFAYVVNGIISICVIPLNRRVSMKVGKQKSYIIGMLIGSGAGVFFWFNEIHSFPVLFVYMIMFAIAMNVYWQMFPSMMYDVCEVDEFKNGTRREGTIVSILSLSEALSAAISVLMMSFFLDHAGFNASLDVQLPEAISAISACFTIIPAGFMLISIITMIIYPLDKVRFEKLQRALEDKKNGREYDTTGLERVL